LETSEGSEGRDSGTPGGGLAIRESQALPTRVLAARSAAGGILMGLANLVPGISGGTMLLAAGVYPNFISAIAELTTLKFKARSILVIALIGGSAALAILLLAGSMKSLVVEQRWAMYSLFIGLTLGGLPLVWRLARPGTPALWCGAVAAFGVMALMALGEARPGGGEANAGLLLLSGVAAASAMMLPGISGGYLLLLLGQYVPILGAIDGLKQALLAGGGLDGAALEPTLAILVPVGIGVLIGVVGVANLLRWLLDRFEKPTLGMLLGLLLGSVVGLYPFQAPTPPGPGDVHAGRVLSALEAAALGPEDWPSRRFDPTPGQAGGALGLILVGLGTTLLVDRIGRAEPPRRAGSGQG
jgi:putative membrane protein